MPGITSGSMVLPTETTNAMGKPYGTREEASYFLVIVNLRLFIIFHK
jgi:hypothetical protein